MWYMQRWFPSSVILITKVAIFVGHQTLTFLFYGGSRSSDIKINHNKKTLRGKKTTFIDIFVITQLQVITEEYNAYPRPFYRYFLNTCYTDHTCVRGITWILQSVPLAVTALLKTSVHRILYRPTRKLLMIISHVMSANFPIYCIYTVFVPRMCACVLGVYFYSDDDSCSCRPAPSCVFMQPHSYNNESIFETRIHIEIGAFLCSSSTIVHLNPSKVHLFSSFLEIKNINGYILETRQNEMK